VNSLSHLVTALHSTGRRIWRGTQDTGPFPSSSCSLSTRHQLVEYECRYEFWVRSFCRCPEWSGVPSGPPSILRQIPLLLLDVCIPFSTTIPRPDIPSNHVECDHLAGSSLPGTRRFSSPSDQNLARDGPHKRAVRYRCARGPYPIGPARLQCHTNLAGPAQAVDRQEHLVPRQLGTEAADLFHRAISTQTLKRPVNSIDDGRTCHNAPPR